MSYWIFKANPEQYRIDDRLRDPDPNIIWRVTRYQDRIQKGDTVFLWRAGKQRGICAVMTVDVQPYKGELKSDRYEIPGAEPVTDPTTTWAKCHIIQRFALIEADAIKKIDGLELFSFFSAFQQATNFLITRPEGMILLQYIEEHKDDPPVEIPVKAPRPALRSSKPGPTRAAASATKSKPAAPTTAPAALLKCAACGRYVVSSDTERHIRENHAGLEVEWHKVK